MLKENETIESDLQVTYKSTLQWFLSAIHDVSNTFLFLFYFYNNINKTFYLYDTLLYVYLR